MGMKDAGKGRDATEIVLLVALVLRNFLSKLKRESVLLNARLKRTMKRNVLLIKFTLNVLDAQLYAERKSKRNVTETVCLDVDVPRIYLTRLRRENAWLSAQLKKEKENEMFLNVLKDRSSHPVPPRAL